MRISTFRSTLKQVLARRYFPYIAAIIAVLLPLASLSTGLSTDDFFHQQFLLGHTGLNNWLAKLAGLFDFINPETARGLLEQGVGPWWTVEELQIAFFRPLSAFTHWLDYQLWPDTPRSMHAHNILWFALIGFTAALFYRRILDNKWIAGLAALLFVLDDAHLVPVTWIANRNILVSLFWGLLTLIMHDRWRREKWRPGLYLAPIFFFLALLGSEGGIAAGAYLIAYAFFIDTDLTKKRAISMLPYFLIGIVWRLGYQIMGFGVHASGLYTDPGREPLRFLAAALERAPLLLYGQFGWPDPTIYSMLSASAADIFLGIVWILLLLLAVIFYPLLTKNTAARFWGMGMLLSLLPVCAMGIPSGRLLAFAGLGGMGLLAQFIGGLIDRAEWVPISGFRKTGLWMIGILMIGLHGIWAPCQFINTTINAKKNAEYIENIINIATFPPKTAQQDVIIVNAPAPFFLVYTSVTKHYHKQVIPAHLRALAPGYFPLHIQRMDPYTLVIRPENGYLPPPGEDQRENHKVLPIFSSIYLFQFFDKTHRDSTHPMQIGQRIELPGIQIEVTALTKDGRPAEAQFRFDHPLEAESFVWLQWDWKNYTYAPFELPAIEKTIEIPGVF